MRVRRLFASVAVVSSVCVSAAWAKGPFVGADVGVSEPLNGNLRGHIRTGFTVNPYVGYKFNDYLGLQGGAHFYYFTEDNHLPEFPKQNRQATTMFGGTFGPRLDIPFRNFFEDTAILEDLEPYITAQGGYFVGTSGRLSQSAPGFFTGGGVNYHLNDALMIGLFGRWNRAYMGPRPTDLGPGQVPGERLSEDIRWLNAGLNVQYDFIETEAPPAPTPAPAPPPIVQREELPPPVRKKIVLRSVYFEFDRSNIRTDAAPVLDEAAGLLRDEGEINIVAEGHTDSIGSDAYNMKLGQRRADSVRNYLVNKGITSKRIRIESFGESRPVATNETAEGRAQNRRVELRVVQPGAAD
ncbi:MAG: OmpA family protein [Deltaproteobacteria bacterium]|nr:OmpA family protein [Deltaproteobacteria bacterium]